MFLQAFARDHFTLDDFAMAGIYQVAPPNSSARFRGSRGLVGANLVFALA
jgi:hypothetical protein